MADARSAARRAAARGTTVIYDESMRRFFSNVLLTFGAGLAITGFVAAYVMNNPDALGLFLTRSGKELSLTGLWWVMTFAELGMVWWMASWRDDADISFGKGMFCFALYAAMNGCTIAPVVSLYTGASVAKVFFITASTFGAAALYGHTTSRDITGWGGFLIMGLIGLLIAMIVNIFLRSPMMDFVISGIGVLLFVALTAWDMQMLRKMHDESGHTVSLVVNGALALYLDFINLFLFFLRFFGVKTSD